MKNYKIYQKRLKQSKRKNKKQSITSLKMNTDLVFQRLHSTALLTNRLIQFLEWDISNLILNNEIN